MNRERIQFDDMTEPGFWENFNKTTMTKTTTDFTWSNVAGSG